MSVEAMLVTEGNVVVLMDVCVGRLSVSVFG